MFAAGSETSRPRRKRWLCEMPSRRRGSISNRSTWSSQRTTRSVRTILPALTTRRPIDIRTCRSFSSARTRTPTVSSSSRSLVQAGSSWPGAVSRRVRTPSRSVPSKREMSVRLVECDRSRAAEILAILNEAIVNSTALYDYTPRTMEMMEAWFEAKVRGNYPVIGAVDEDGRFLGFGTYGPFRQWPAYKYTVEHSIYVELENRGKGVGKILLSAIIERAKQQQYHTLIGGIDTQNAASIALHARFGFEFCGRV